MHFHSLGSRGLAQCYVYSAAERHWLDEELTEFSQRYGDILGI